MKRPCDACGTIYEAKRATSKFCGVNCRTRAHTNPDILKTPEPIPVAASGLAGTVQDSLAKVGRLDTVAGQQALLLAYRIEGAHDGAVAGLSKELREVMTVALAGLAQVADPMDELKSRRDRLRAG